MMIEFINFQKQTNNVKNPFFDPFLINTNFMEKTFSFMRMMHGDVNSNYCTVLAKWRLLQEMMSKAYWSKKKNDL